MNDHPADETPIQRALRLKTAANEARTKGGGGKIDRRSSAGMGAGKSRPSPKAR